MQEEISFGIWLRKQRRALDLSRQAFANQVGCAEITLHRIEAGTLSLSFRINSITASMNRGAAACTITNSGETDRDSVCFSRAIQFQIVLSMPPF